jgi:hypothetical protein
MTLSFPAGAPLPGHRIRRPTVAGGYYWNHFSALFRTVPPAASFGPRHHRITTTTQVEFVDEIEATPTAAVPVDGWLFFTEHEAAVIREATARLVPGPCDDPDSTVAGAREADVVGYIDRLLAALTLSPPGVYAGGPWSDRAGGDANHMARFTPLSTAQRVGWQQRLEQLQGIYRGGIADLDACAGGDFAAAGAAARDRALSQPRLAGFRDRLFDHTVEGMYAIPEYGGNRGLAGWRSIGFRGDTQPVGYTDREVTRPDGPDPVWRAPVVARLLEQFGLGVSGLVHGDDG